MAKFFVLSILLLIGVVHAQESDSLQTWEMNTVEISARRIGFGRLDVPMRKEAVSSILSQNGFSLVRRGVPFAQDIAVDGFRRGDIVVVVDEERYHSACPNRMDSPLTRVNPLELANVVLDKSSIPPASGLAGSVQFRRRPPSENFRLHTSFAGSADALRSIDAAVMAEGAHHALSLRYATGDPYRDGDGMDFGDRYGYHTLPGHMLAETGLRGSAGHWKYGGSFAYTENVLFPYLLMDEIYNRVWNGHVQWKQFRFYTTYTDHLMTNEHRYSAVKMRTAARNLTVGVSGDHFEVWMRRWDADNRFNQPDSVANAQMGKTVLGEELSESASSSGVLEGPLILTNHLMPEVYQYYGAASSGMTCGAWHISLRGGLTHLRIGDDSRLAFYREVFADAENGRNFPLVAATLQWRRRDGLQSGYGFQVEVATESPQAEELYVTVRKPGDKPAWIGNPTLAQPVRGTLRGSARWHALQAEAFCSSVANYVQPAKRSGSQGMYQTFENVDALLVGVTMRYERKLLTADVAWTWGQHLNNSNPLSEIPPLRAQLQLRSPEWQRVLLHAGIVTQAAQYRIDPTLGEDGTPGWLRVDAGLRWNGSMLRADLTVENLFDNNYRQHLSYLRNPFAAGNQVWEPGRVVRLQLHAVLE
ncbi:TonB-dependent receptor [bacterium]|nr:TonB-dependent receptor [bacterium]